jgi:hypothetical protein
MKYTVCYRKPDSIGELVDFLSYGEASRVAEALNEYFGSDRGEWVVVSFGFEPYKGFKIAPCNYGFFRIWTNSETDSVPRPLRGLFQTVDMAKNQIDKIIKT